MKIAFFDAKTYDKPGFDHYIQGTDHTIKYFETRLNEDTVSLAAGFDAVCVFVNDIVNETVVNALYDMGVKDEFAYTCLGTGVSMTFAALCGKVGALAIDWHAVIIAVLLVGVMFGWGKWKKKAELVMRD